jgi:hypothetical protein
MLGAALFRHAVFRLLCTSDRSEETNQAPDESRKSSPVVIETGRSGFAEIRAGCSVLVMYSRLSRENAWLLQ